MTSSTESTGMNCDSWSAHVPLWATDESLSSSSVFASICGKHFPGTDVGASTVPSALVSISEYPDAIPRLRADAPRDPLAALPQSPVSTEPATPPSLTHAPETIPTQPQLTRSHRHASASAPTSTPTKTPPVRARARPSSVLVPTCVHGDRCALPLVPCGTSLRAPLDLLAGSTSERASGLVGGTLERAVRAWRAQRGNASARDAVAALIMDGGIRLERRKRLGSRVDPDQKKVVRAQRNRERSQALRRHAKRRLWLLDEATDALECHCRALGALARALATLSGRQDELQAAIGDAGVELAQFMASKVPI